MKSRAIFLLISIFFSAVAFGGEQRRAGILPLQPPQSTSNTDTANPTNPNPPVSSGTSLSSTTSSTTPPTSTPGQTGITGFPSITGPSLPLSSSSSESTLSSTSSLPTTQTSTVIITSTPTDTPSTSISSSAAPTNTGDGGGGNTSVSTGTIVGLSVAGGIAVFGAVAFIIWKLTRKRFSEFDADGEEIKWPELGPESHALPTRPTGRVGVDDDGFDSARLDGAGAGRQLRNYPASSTIGDTSTGDLHSYNDPYAVPPLPHLDPNQPYHDDPSLYGAHYDPYRGPVPPSFHDPASERMGSPAPGGLGRQSPGPSIAYNRAGY